MTEEYKKLLIVDDSEIDREVLKSILSDEFDIIEAENGYNALKIIMNGAESLDAILLDVSMPILDGFHVLEIMESQKVNTIPIFMITAEATKDNVERAKQLNVTEFIRKPFDRYEILKRVKAKLGIVTCQNINEEDIPEMMAYIAELEKLYNRYLINSGRGSGHYTRMRDLMKILLNRYSEKTRGVNLDSVQVELISKAAFFCDIGIMLLANNSRQRDDVENEVYQSHTVFGADIVRLNHAKSCEYFVQICADMCMHHHERYDGNGFPDRLVEDKNFIYTLMCRMADEFDILFYKYREHNELQFEYVVNSLAQDKGAVNPELILMLAECKETIMAYYTSQI